MYSEAMYNLGKQQSPIRELFEYGLKQSQILGADKVYDFTLGNPSVLTPAEVTACWLELLQTENPLVLHSYTVGAGRLETRQAIARNLNQRFATNYGPEHLFITCGAAAALTSVIKALTLNPASEIIALAPYFTEYEAFVNSCGARFVTVPAAADFRLNLAQLEQELRPQTQAIIINSPNNPSGKVYTAAELSELAALLRRKSAELGHPIYLISDEPYRELAYGVEVPFIPQYYADCLICYSYSKIFSIPGARIGYVLVPPQVTDALAIYKAVAGAARGQGYVCAPSLTQRVIERCVGVKPELTVYERNRAILYDGLTKLGYDCVRPDGAFYLFVQAPAHDAKAFSDLAKSKNLLLVPGNGFGCSAYVRVSYCVPTHKLEQALPLFAELKEQYA